jgi:uroporphyrinogen-III synthase
MVKPVIVTRPAHQAEPLIKVLRARAIEVLPLPLTEIVALADPGALRATLSRLDSFRLVVFVSANAIAHMLAVLPGSWPEALAVAVMGQGSRTALALRGIAAPRYQVIAPEPSAASAEAVSDSEALFAQLDLGALGAGPVLIVKGNDGREWLAEQLRARGIRVEQLESYQRRAATPDASAMATLRAWMVDERAVQIVVTSREGLARLVELVTKTGDPAASRWLYAQRLVVPHPRIAQNATALGFARADLVALDDSRLVDALE